MLSLRSLLKDCTLIKSEVDRFLDEEQKNWAYYDPQLGYLLKDNMVRDGMNDAVSVYRYEQSGERKMINYADQPCRLNTYGNSFTQCHQVSDGETWQEYLAAHWGEPIRNYGVGGHGVYQAYKRMLREEYINPASNVILNVWTDDHFRSIDRWRWIRTGQFRKDFRKSKAHMFHANPWSYLRMNEEGKFQEYPNEYPTPESLYTLCDEEHVYEAFKDDVIVHLHLAAKGEEFNKAILLKAAEMLELKVKLDNADAAAKSAKEIHTQYALAASMYIVDEARKFTEESGKKLMVLTSYSSPNVQGCVEGKERFDQKFIDYLEENTVRHIDTLKLHEKDYKQFNLTSRPYLERYYVNGTGHYNPIGNHFFAFAINQELVRWLEPKPLAYTDNEESSSKLADLLA